MLIDSKPLLNTCVKWALTSILLVALLTACGSDDAESTASNGGSSSDNQITIVASTSIIGALASEVAGTHGDVTALMGPGVDPHLFEATPGDLLIVNSADVVFVNGIEFDDFLLDEIESANDQVPVVTVTQGIELLGSHDEEGDEHDDEDGHDSEHADEEEGDEHDGDSKQGDEDEHADEEEGDEHDGDSEQGDEDEHDSEDEEEHHNHHGEFDPHVWQDPLRVKIMVSNIADALAEIDPEHAEDYQSNAEAYLQTLDETDAQIRELVDQIPTENRKLVTNHDAFGYFADRYGFELVGAVIPSFTTAADPSAGSLAELSHLILEEGIKAIFAEELVDPKVAEQLAADTGVTMVYGLYTGAIGEPGTPGDTVHGMLLANAQKMSEALQ